MEWGHPWKAAGGSLGLLALLAARPGRGLHQHPTACRPAVPTSSYRVSALAPRCAHPGMEGPPSVSCWIPDPTLCPQ